MALSAVTISRVSLHLKVSALERALHKCWKAATGWSAFSERENRL